MNDRPLRLADALRIDPNAPPAPSLLRDPAIGRLVEPAQMSPIGLDLYLNSIGAQQSYDNRNPPFDASRALYQLMQLFRPQGGPPTAYNPGPAQTFPPSYGRAR